MLPEMSSNSGCTYGSEQEDPPTVSGRWSSWLLCEEMEVQAWTASCSALLLTSTQSERLKDKTEETEETFWEEQTQRGTGSIWFVLRADGTDASLEQLQKPLLFSEDISKDLGSANHPPNTPKRPPGSSCQLCFAASCVSASPQLHLLTTGGSSGWREATGSALGDADVHLLTCPELSSSPGQFPVPQLLPTPLQRFKSSGSEKHTQRKSWVALARGGAAVVLLMVSIIVTSRPDTPDAAAQVIHSFRFSSPVSSGEDRRERREREVRQEEREEKGRAATSSSLQHR